MDRKRVRLSAEAYTIRGRGWVRLAVQLVGAAAMLIGAFNLLFADYVVWDAVLTVYRDVLGSVITYREDVLADIALMVVGAVLAWFV